ncbi:MAG: GNAT family N-acetyltransferase [Bacteroidales bacterium]
MTHFLEASLNDAPLLERLAREIWHLHYPSILSVEQIEFMLDVHYSIESIERSMNAGACWFTVEIEGVVVGFFSVARCNDKLWKLEKIYIHPSAHNRGIGREAIGFLDTFLKQKGAITLTLNVNRKNQNSIEAYRKFGFKIIREEDNYLGKFLLDDYVMELELND